MATLVQSAAEKIISEHTATAGTLTPSDILSLERCDVHTMLVVADLSTEILLFEEEDEDAFALSYFAQVVTENILEGNSYEYITPQRARVRHSGALLRQEIIRLSGLDEMSVDRLLRIRYVKNACIPGFVIHHVDLSKLPARANHLLDRISRFIYPDPDDVDLGYIATATPASPSSQRYSLIAKEYVPDVIHEFAALGRNT